MKKHPLAVLAIMILVFCAPHALSAGEEWKTEAAMESAMPSSGLSSDEAAAGYIQKVLCAPRQQAEIRVDGTALQSRLKGPNLWLYLYLREEIQKVAAGQRTSTIFRIPAEVILPQTAYTAKELGVSHIANAKGNLGQDAVNAFFKKVKPDFSVVVEALMGDLPFDLYWFDKTVKYDFTTPGYLYSRNRIRLEDNAEFVLRMCVAKEYAANNTVGSYTISSERGASIWQAAETARRIVNENSGRSDLQKLEAYKNAICELVDYNHTADSPDQSYGNPWQLIWVFDGNPKTKAVCEGYAKAFQYLCDLSDFQENITVMCMYGYTSVPHMWNVVTMSNGKRYLVDVTNCDKGGIGYPDQLFMAGYIRAKKTDNGTLYYYRCDDSEISYLFVYDVENLYTEEDSTMSPAEYGKAAETDHPEDVQESRSSKLVDIGSLIYRLDRQKKEATVTGASRGSLTSFVIPATIRTGETTYKVTSIENDAFQEMKKLTKVTIGKNVKTIGKNAFRECTKLESVIIKGTKISKIRTNAFKVIHSKASIRCPKEKYSEYKEMISKSGIPKSVTILALK